MAPRRLGGADFKLRTREPAIFHLAVLVYAAIGIGVLIRVKLSSTAKDNDPCSCAFVPVTTKTRGLKVSSVPRESVRGGGNQDAFP